MQFLSEQRHDGVLERHLTHDDVPGILWTPDSGPAPLILLGHPGGLQPMHQRLLGRARDAAQHGFASLTIELPGAGVRPRIPELEQARTDLRSALAEGRPVDDAIVDALVLTLVDLAAPEWRSALDAALELPEVEGPVGISGGVIALAVRLAVTDPRIAAALLFAGSFVPRSTFEEARRLRIPVHVLLQWDDAGNDRQRALDLFDAFATAEKTLHANMGGHTGVPAFEADPAMAFLVRHLWPGPTVGQ
ncbi:alpha/beta hydrolase [Aeromicrobium tamlense]|uniref:Alpha/beta hydrolase n=1 Tax=Aeromicrobium tamlense TaxID=375541 RepID=A0A8I0KLN4_9ACTN|nr:alpha/beta hydrolase [Aeromicrobium tamlense]MBD1268809.1 alpha/beta hydrolase [Aeromicrobium tamlense]NYI37285.1 dienelactone hydrolase [Aeromicrobium tamlense]